MMLLETLPQLKIKVGNFSSLPYLVAQDLPKQLPPSILIFAQDDIKFLAVIDHNLVYLTQNFDRIEELKDHLQQLIQIARNKFDLKIEKLISISDQDLFSLQLKIDKVEWQLTDLKFVELIGDHRLQPKTESDKGDSNQKDNGQVPTISSPSLSSRNKRTLLLLALLGLVILVAIPILVWKLWWQPNHTVKNIDTPAAEVIVEPSVAPEPASPSPSPEFFANLYSVKILNGSGIAGLAADTQEILVTEGYEDLEVGNANNQNYEQTEIITEYEELRSDLVQILEKEYKLTDSPSNSTTDPDFDAIIILGQNKAEN